MDIRLRAAPSPTGRIHTGNLRTFLNSYLAAKSMNGTNILRVEDTDQKRKVEGGLEGIIETLSLYGITYDEGPHVGGNFGPYIQSERIEIYKKYAHELVEKGFAYYCFCTKERLEELKNKQESMKLKPQYDRHCRNLSPDEVKSKLESGKQYVIRMKFPLDGALSFKDEIYGEIKINNKEIEDMVLLKSDGFPTYHFGVVVDDHLMGITHVFRGREYLTQTTRNVFLYNSFGWDQPKWIHTPAVLNPNGKGKLSKRFGARSALAYLRLGYFPEAVINYLILCGWAPKNELAHQDEIYTLEELKKLFSIDRMQKTNARFDQAKMDYINSKHIRNLNIDDLASKVIFWAEKYVLATFIADKFDEHQEWEDILKAKVTKYLPMWKNDMEKFKKVLKLEYERIKYLSELPDSLDFFYEDEMTWEDSDWNMKNHNKLELSDALENILPKLEIIFKDNVFNHDIWESVVRGYADELGWKHGDLFLAIRSATTGRLQSPPLLDCYNVMGWSKVKEFILQAIVWLRK